MEATKNNPTPHATPVEPVDGNGTHGAHHEHDEAEIPTDLPRPSSFTVIAVGLAFVILLVALFVIGYIPRHAAEKEAQADAAEKTNDAPVVSVVPAKEAATTKDLILPADVAAFQDTSLFSRANGYLKKMYVDIQDHVKAGDLLAEIDTPEVDAQLQQSRAALEQSKAAVDKAKSDLSLAQKTLDRYLEAQKNTPGSVTQEDLDTKIAQRDQAASALKQTEANVGAAEADVQRLTVMQGFEKIYAPFSGTITARGYYVGALLSSNGGGSPVFRLQQTDPLKVWVQVPQSYSNQIKTGQDVFLRVRNFGDKEFKGTVARTSASLEQATRTMMFELHFPNPDGLLYPGMYGQVRMGVSQPHPVIVIPTSAMVFNSSGTQVVLVKDGKAHFQQITVGRDLGTELEVVDGVAKDDVVISNPGERITDGGEVQITGDQTRTAEKPQPNKPQGEKLAEKS